MSDNKARIEKLLSMAWNTNSTTRILAIADQILELEPGSIEALILKADNTSNDQERLGILMRAHSSLSYCEPDYVGMFTFAIDQRLAYTLFAVGKHNEALAYCETALEIAKSEGDSDILDEANALKKLYYRTLIELKQWQKILEQTMRDEERSLAWAYARLISAWMLAPERCRSVCANMFWDALMLGPNVPFYILGSLEEPDDDAGPVEHEEFNFALMYYDAVSVSDEFYRWFSRGAILFGLLSNRFDSREREYMLDVLDSLGGFEEYERMSKILVESDDAAVIEMLAANKCLSE